MYQYCSFTVNIYSLNTVGLCEKCIKIMLFLVYYIRLYCICILTVILYRIDTVG